MGTEMDKSDEYWRRLAQEECRKYAKRFSARSSAEPDFVVEDTGIEMSTSGSDQSAWVDDAEIQSVEGLPRAHADLVRSQWARDAEASAQSYCAARNARRSGKSWNEKDLDTRSIREGVSSWIEKAKRRGLLVKS